MRRCVPAGSAEDWPDLHGQAAPVAKAKRGTPERTIQIAILRWARLVLPPGSVVAAIKNEEAPRSDEKYARARFQAARKVSGTLVGMPDLVCILPGGQTAWLEIKAPGGVVSDAQQGVHDRLRALGHVVGLATSIEAARAVLQNAGVPLREAAGQLLVPTKVRTAKRHPSGLAA